MISGGVKSGTVSGCEDHTVINHNHMHVKKSPADQDNCIPSVV